MKVKQFFKTFIVFLFANTCWIAHSSAQQDTLRVVAYNVLHYGDGCQGSNSFLHSILKTTVQYANPDVLGLVKVQSIKLNSSDTYGLSPVGFADSILSKVLNSAYPSRYAYCTLTNFSHSPDDDMDILFYDKSKLGFVSVVNLCTLEEDFDLYKLYYKDPNLSATHDSTFLYFVLNHTKSGNSTNERNQQDSIVVQGLKNRFTHLPNLISMGDFNTHATTEPGYELLTATTDTNFLFFDPPFNPDHVLSYPIDWDSNPSLCPAYLNTSTRHSSSNPNNCGTNGGAKDWYIHILLSHSIVNNSDHIKYIPNSYTTIGNDGLRTGVSINDNSPNANTSVPSNVLTALFNQSDKYPIMIKLGITYNTGTTSILPMNNTLQHNITTNNPIHNTVTIHFPPDAIGQKAIIAWFTISGELIHTEEYGIDSTEVNKAVDLIPGIYLLHIQVGKYDFTARIVKE